MTIFKDSIIFYRSVYLHFLDGLVSTNKGAGDFICILHSLNLADFKEQDIKFGQLEHFEDFSTLTFYNENLSLNDEKLFMIEHDSNEMYFCKKNQDDQYSNDFQSVSEQSSEEEFNKLSKDEFEKLNIDNDLSYFNFCIIPISFNKHQTTTIIFIKQNSMYLYILNTGLDINVNGEIREINGSNLYQLTKGIILCENINDPEQVRKAFRTLNSFFYIGYFYNYIDKNYYSNYNEREFNFTFNINFNIKLEKFKSFLTDYSEKKILNYLGDNSINEIICFVDESININKKFDNSEILIWIINYYPIISDFLDNYEIKKIGDIVNINHYNQQYIDKLKINPKLTNDFLKKIIIYNSDKNIYIYDQESGSCSWFSIYFSLLLYYVINTDQSNYIRFINKINESFYNYLLDIFNDKNFKYEFQKIRYKKNIESHYYFYMLKLCSKLIDIKLFDNKILYDQQEIIYNTNLKLEISGSIPTNDIYKYNYDNFYEEKNDDVDDLEAHLMDDNFKLLLRLKFVSFNDFSLTAYLIYLNKRVFFKEYDVNKIITKLKISLSLSENNLFIRNISNYLLIFNNTYKLKHDMEKFPSYITFFIPIILYINNNNNKYESILLDFDKGKKNLFDCCLVFTRFYIIIKIIELCHKNSDDDQKFKNLFRLIILNLIHTVVDIKNINLKKYNPSFNDIPNNIFNFYNLFSDYFTNDENKIHFILDSFDEKFDNLLIIEDFFLKNPNLITKEFLIYNSYRLSEEQRIKLIQFYSRLIYNNEDNLGTYFNIFYILLFDADYAGSYIKTCEISDDNFKKKLILLKKESMNEEIYFNKIIKYNFIEDKFNIIPNYNFETLQIGDIQTFKVIAKSSLFTEQFILITTVNSDSIFDIYCIIKKNYIRYVCRHIYEEVNIINFMVLKIYFNGNEVFRFDSIIYPFKYVIPITDIYYIYKENDIFKITYDIKFDFDNTLLGNINIDNKIYNYEINPNTLFFLNKFSSNSDFENWENLCCDLQLNSYNILYVNLNKKNTDETGYSVNNKRYPAIFHFNKDTLFKEKIKYNLTEFKLFDEDLSYLVDLKIENIDDEQLTKSYKKLLFKISECDFKFSKKWIEKFNIIKTYLKSKIKDFTNYIKNINFSDLLLNKYEILQSYLLNIKILNLIKKLLENIGEERILCSIIKNYKILFDTKKKPHQYIFEILFELIADLEISNEQMERYNIMIKSYEIYSQTGGSIEDELKENLSSLIYVKKNFDYEEIPLELCKGNFYQLHHFMMGKGKSTIITPLLSLYFYLLKKQKIYIIVPKHLINQTNIILNDYINIFEIENIHIKSDDEIKNDFLNEKFISTKNTVFLIDEFDSLINPLKSNFNLVKEKSVNIDSFIEIIKIITERYKENIKNIQKSDILSIIKDKSFLMNKEELADNLISIVKQLENGELKYNIQWGIDSKNLYAVPYRNKDKPIENSSFISCVLTIFLTYYYYIIINKYNIDKNIYNFLLKDEFLKKFFKIDLTIINIDIVNEILNSDEEKKNIFFNYFFTKILGTIKLPEKHYNTSFVDIINIDNIFKLGYSGTVNIVLPKLDNRYQFNTDCLFNDDDESTNIEFAISKSEIINSNLPDLDRYDALIDISGYYYNQLNYNVALDIHIRLNREVIFINENDEKMIIIDRDILIKLNEKIKYKNPFFYFDQSHIVGIDIKQENYPILHGLCIIDNLSFYSEVAQAMFRLRKLNLGHTISFFLFNFELNNTKELLCKLRYNEINLINQQTDLLNLQALKSDIRKIGKNKIFIKNYEEKLFYYFLNSFDIDPLSYIFNQEEIRMINSKDYLKKYNLLEEKVKKIVFNLDFKTVDIQHQVSNQENIEAEAQAQAQAQSEKEEIVLIKKIRKILETLNKINKYKFKNFEFMKTINNQENYDKYTIKLNNILSFLPNIFFINFDTIMYCINIDKFLFNTDLIFMYVHFIQKFILIPKYMILYLYNDFLFYDFNYNIINLEKKEFHNQVKLNELENNFFSKIITNNFNVDDFNLLKCKLDLIKSRKSKTVIRTYLIATIYFYRNLRDNDFINHNIKELIPFLFLNLNKIIDTLLNLSKYDNLIRKIYTFIPHKIDSLLEKKNRGKLTFPPKKEKHTKYPDRFGYKYLKYKKKYLKLKELLDI